MAQLITPNTVKVVSQNGEVTISLKLDLNINLNQNGGIASIDATDTGNEITKKIIKKSDDDVQWEIPDFGPSKKINFGK